MALSRTQLTFGLVSVIGLAGCYGTATGTRKQAPTTGAGGSEIQAMGVSKQSADISVSLMPVPPFGLIEPNGPCVDSPVAFVSDSAKYKAGWHVSGYDERLKLWAERHFGKRAVNFSAHPACFDGRFAVRAWQTTLGSLATGVLTETEGKRLVDIVDHTEPAFIVTKNKLAKKAPEVAPQRVARGEKTSNELFSVFGFTLGEPFRRPWCGGVKVVRESCWTIAEGNVWGYLGGAQQQVPGSRKGLDTGLLRVPAGSIPFSSADIVNVKFVDGILVEVFIDSVFRKERANIAKELIRVVGPAAPTEEKCMTSQWVDKYGWATSAPNTTCWIGNNYKGHPDRRSARLACFQPDGHCQVTLEHFAYQTKPKLD